MKQKTNTVTHMLRQEITTTVGPKRYLLLALLFNLPFIGFMPYLSQAITVVMLALFIKHTKGRLSKPTLLLAAGTMIFQAFWFPFTSQIVTLILIGLILITMNKDV